MLAANPTYAAAASATLRVPAQFSTMICEGRRINTVPALTPNFDAQRDAIAAEHGPKTVFGARLNESYEDAGALMNGERGYVTQALKFAKSIVVIRTAGKDPLLLAMDWQQSPCEDPLSSRVMFSDDVTHDIKVDGLESVAKGNVMHLAFQQIKQGTNPFANTDAQITAHKYKKYSTVTIPKGIEAFKGKGTMNAFDPTGCFFSIPRACITSSKASARMLTLQLERDVDASAVAPKLFNNKTVQFAIIKNKGAIRIVVPEGTAMDPDNIKKFAVDIGGIRAVVFEATGQRLIIGGGGAGGDPRVTISTLDGTPMPNAAAQLIAKHFGLRDVKMVDGFMMARASIENAKMIHGARIVGTFIGFCKDIEEAAAVSAVEGSGGEQAAAAATAASNASNGDGGPASAPAAAV
jgi:hypothetical protein